MMRDLIRTAAAAGPLLTLTTAALKDLTQECGSPEAAVAFLTGMAAETGRPIGFHLDGQTFFVAPRDWTQERLAGYVGARHEELAATFGEIEEVRHAGG
jgi:hypothetical protein